MDLMEWMNKSWVYSLVKVVLSSVTLNQREKNFPYLKYRRQIYSSSQFQFPAKYYTYSILNSQTEEWGDGWGELRQLRSDTVDNIPSIVCLNLIRNKDLEC